MNADKIALIMKKHSIRYHIVSDDAGRVIFVEEVYTINGEVGSQWINATNWNMKKVKDWLGY